MAGITTVEAVASHVPGFINNSPAGPQDPDISVWIDARWEEIQTILVRRGLPMPAAQTDGFAALELVNRLGAASDLAAALSAKFSSGQPWPVLTGLRQDFLRMLQRLEAGAFDKLLLATARTADVAPQVVGVAGQETDPHPDETLNVAFQKGQIF